MRKMLGLGSLTSDQGVRGGGNQKRNANWYPLDAGPRRSAAAELVIVIGTQ